MVEGKKQTAHGGARSHLQARSTDGEQPLLDGMLFARARHRGQQGHRRLAAGRQVIE